MFINAKSILYMHNVHHLDHLKFTC